jgi:hypothetical protein
MEVETDRVEGEKDKRSCDKSVSTLRREVDVIAERGARRRGSSFGGGLWRSLELLVDEGFFGPSEKANGEG